jgi:hypothetical protein
MDREQSTDRIVVPLKLPQKIPKPYQKRKQQSNHRTNLGSIKNSRPQLSQISRGTNHQQENHQDR